MKQDCDKLLKQLPDYLKDNLTEEQKAEFENRLAVSSCKDEFESLREVWQRLLSMPDAEPGEAVQTRFHAMLEAYKTGEQHAHQRVGLGELTNRWLERWWPRQPVFQMALALGLLVCGVFLGSRFNSSAGGELGDLRGEVSDLRRLVATSLLQSQSPSERLRGVSYSNRLEQPDESVLRTLLNTMDYDPNLNVRLAAVDALSAFYDQELIRHGALESLERQSSPLLQIALIDLLVQQEERRSLKLLKAIQGQESVEQMVRQHAGKAIQQLE